MNIIFATNNQHKLNEVRALLEDRFELLGLSDINCVTDIPENEPTLEGNALSKARFIYEKYNSSCFADDTGLEVEILNGEPGVYSARYSGESHKTDKERSEANIQKLLKNLNGKTNRNARFRTVIAYIHEGKEYLFEGIVNGKIIEHKRGTEGFGYDSIFVPEDKKTTFAEMSMQEKGNISHRARAFNNFVNFLLSK